MIVACRSSRSEVFCKKGVLRNFGKFTGKHLCQSLFLVKLHKTMERVFSCEFYEIFKVNFLQETPAAAASDIGMWQALYAEKMCQLLAEFLPIIKLSVQIVISLIH